MSAMKKRKGIMLEIDLWGVQRPCSGLYNKYV